MHVTKSRISDFSDDQMTYVINGLDTIFLCAEDLWLYFSFNCVVNSDSKQRKSKFKYITQTIGDS